jgi:hypothetical protein
MKKSRQGHWQAQAYATMPTPEMTPRRAFQRLMAGDAEEVPLGEMAGRVVGVGVIPYPPGIPIVMPGENIGKQNGPWLTYLRTLQEWGHRFPGFAKEVEGTEEKGRRLPRLLLEGIGDPGDAGLQRRGPGPCSRNGSMAGSSSIRTCSASETGRIERRGASRWQNRRRR